MIYLLSRSAVFSPNAVHRDEAIFRAIRRQFIKHGEEVACYSEDELTADPTLLLEADSYGSPIIVSMGRDVRTLRILERLETMGFRVYNSPSSLLENSRLQIDAVMDEVGLGMKTLSEAADAETTAQEIGFPLWIKTARTSTQTPDDVQYIASRESLERAIDTFLQRGCTEWMCCEHVEGDLIKFYGVEGTDFFYWAYPCTKNGYSKFGKEVHNGKPQGYAFNAEELKESMDEAAAELGMFIYGGDAVVRADGTIVVVDFNDFPSFSPCLEAAAEAIVARVMSEL